MRTWACLPGVARALILGFGAWAAVMVVPVQVGCWIRDGFRLPPAPLAPP